MTKKTGNYKKYTVFVEMLVSAIHRVLLLLLSKLTYSSRLQIRLNWICLLTPEDLRQLQVDNGLQPTIQTDRKKVYLILTYSVAFDRYIPFIASIMQVIDSIEYSIRCPWHSRSNTQNPWERLKAFLP